MKNIRRTAQISEGIPTSSQSDIAFLLIIFFMVAAVFTTPEGLNIFLPKKDTQPRTVPAENLLIVNLSDEGIITLNNTAISLSELFPRVKEQKENNPQIVVLFKVDGGCPYGYVVSAVNELQKIPDLRISFKTIGAGNGN